MDTKEFVKVIRKNNPFTEGHLCEVVNPHSVLKVLNDTSHENMDFWINQIDESGLSEDGSHDACLYATNLMAISMAIVEQYGTDNTRADACMDWLDALAAVVNGKEERLKDLIEQLTSDCEDEDDD